VVVADVLQRARNASDKIFLPDDGHLQLLNVPIF
jgi:hypothetical protein